MKNTKTWAIIGGGNGGQGLAGHLGLMGFKTRLYDIVPATVEAINASKQIVLKGAVNGQGPVEFATSNIEEAVKGADYIMITVPAMAHAELARQLAPHLNDGVYVYLHPGAALGALEFYQLIKKSGCRAEVAVSEANSLIYACRAEKPGLVNIYGVKKDLQLGTIPAARNKDALAPFQACFPQTRGAKNVFESSLAYTNTVLHPGPSLLNVALIESKYEWRYYVDGFSQTIGRFMEAMDKERMALCRSLDVPGDGLLEWFKKAYGVQAQTLSEAASSNPSYQEVKGQKSMYTRYILEDIPNGLVPYVELGRLFGVPTPLMESIIGLGYQMLDEKAYPEKRTLRRMGLDHLSAQELMDYVTNG